MVTTVTRDQVVAAIEIILEVGKLIREISQSSPLGGVPSGELYARLCGHFSLETYNKIIGNLKKAGVVKESNFLLTWVGPNQKNQAPHQEEMDNYLP